MKLKYVTLTGADDSVNPEKLIELSLKYPYVEWGILFSKSKSGRARYPSKQWVDSLIDLAEKQDGLNFSAHLCGGWVEEALNGYYTFLHNKRYGDHFGRIQLNMGKSLLGTALKNKMFIHVAKSLNRRIILGGNYSKVNPSGAFFNALGICPLFDESGGKGVKPKKWPKILSYVDSDVNSSKMNCFCGYAGGLGPMNLLSELARIEESVGDADIWIDMESSLRMPKNKFSIEICEIVLQMVKPWIG